MIFPTCGVKGPKFIQQRKTACKLNPILRGEQPPTCKIRRNKLEYANCLLIFLFSPQKTAKQKYIYLTYVLCLIIQP